jgi:hypothetical protein
MSYPFSGSMSLFKMRAVQCCALKWSVVSYDAVVRPLVTPSQGRKLYGSSSHRFSPETARLSSAIKRTIVLKAF